MAIAAGARYTLALKDDGTVWTWGSNNRSQLGTGTADGPERAGSSWCRTTPARVHLPGGAGFLSGIVVIAGGLHPAAVGSDGTVWTWGVNNTGQLGRASDEICGDVACSSTAGQVRGPSGNGTLNAVTSVSAGLDHTLALKSDERPGRGGRTTTPSSETARPPGPNSVASIHAARARCRSSAACRASRLS